MRGVNKYTNLPSTQLMYYLYLIKNREQGSTYIGYTNNLERRMLEHKEKNPKLIYYEAYRDERDARNREARLKQRVQAVRWLKSRLKHSLESQV